MLPKMLLRVFNKEHKKKKNISQCDRGKYFKIFHVFADTVFAVQHYVESMPSAILVLFVYHY